MFKTKLSGLQENVPLAPYTTFKIGGPARYFFIAKTEAAIVEAVAWAKAEGIEYAVLGGGSNLLVSDQGFAGLIVKYENIDFKIEGNKVYAGGGLNLGFFVSQCAENGLAGAEFLIGIPGTIGGAVRGNAGAWGQGMGELVASVKMFDGSKVQELNQHACRFSYRSSLIKERGHIVLAVVLQLQKGIREEIQAKINDYLRQRSSNQPPQAPSAGCAFKNIELRAVDLDAEKVRKALDVSAEEFAQVTKHGKLPAGYLIEKLDLKGKKIGGAEIYPKHGNFIISDGTATAADVVALVSFIKQQVRDKIGIQLEEEIQYLGF